jgi:tetratricopeptide (TPR) repeat protein
LVALVVVGSALAIGAVHVPVILALAALATGAALLAARAHLLPGEALPAPALVVLLLSAYSALQALPLPAGVVAAIAPQNADVWAHALDPFRERGPSWVSVSLDPGASLVEAVKWLMYAAVFTAAAAAGARRGAAFGALAALGSATLVALVTVAHGLTGATRVFGLYEPTFAPSRWHVGPFLNPNNLAGYLNFGILAGLGLMLMPRPAVPRWVVGLAVATVIGAAVIAGSRGGLLALPIGLLVVVALPRADAVSRRALRWSLVSVLLGGALLAVLGASRHTFQELLDENFEKIEVMSWARPMIAEHPWLGIGRGAFETVFPAYLIGPNDVVYSHPENFIAQWLSEWGVPLSVAALLALAWFLRPKALDATRDPVAAGVVAGVTAVVAQNFFDLGLEVAALPIALAAALGACWGAVRRRRSERGDRDLWPGPAGIGARPVVAVGGVAIAGLLVLAATFSSRTATADRIAVGASYNATDPRDAGERRELRQELRAAMLRHPAEPYYARIGALLALYAGDQNPLPWIGRALERALTSGRNHYVLSRVLAARGAKQQALLELRLALEYDPRLNKRASRLAARLTQDCAELERAVPFGPKGAAPLTLMALALDERDHGADRARCLDAAVRRDTAYAPARVAAVKDVIRAIAASAERCADARRDVCLQRAEANLAALERADGGRGFQPLELRARLELARGRPDVAERLLAGRCSGVSETDRGRCLELRVSAAASVAKDDARLAAAVRDMLAGGCEIRGSCAKTYAWLGDLLAARGDWNGALGYYRQAVRENSSPGVWRKLAGAAEHVGARAEAEAAAARAAQARGAITQ